MNLYQRIRQQLFGTEKLSVSYVDRIFWILYGILFLVSVVALFSASASLVYKSGSMFGPVGKQAFFLLGGAAIAWGIQFMRREAITTGSKILLGITDLILYGMLVPGLHLAKTVNGAGRWINVFGFTIQPSEFAKVFMMIVIADILAKAGDKPEDMRQAFIKTLAIAGITIFPIMIGNLSTAVLMAAVVWLLWIIAGIDWKYWVGALLTVVVLGVGGLLAARATIHSGHELPKLFSRAATWVNRIDAMLDNQSETVKDDDYYFNDDHYQSTMAKIAIARGAKTPFGVFPGNSKGRNFLPLAYADYIFAIIVEESGIIGAIFLIFLYLAILFRACLVSTRFKDPGAMLLTMGLALMLVCQAFISMAVAVGIGPVTGQPLPMITMGGTSALATAMYFGVIMAVSYEQKVVQHRIDAAEEESMNDMPDID